MKRLTVLLAMLICFNAWGANVWEEGSGADVISGTDSPSDIDSLLDAASTEPLSRLLQDFREGAELVYSSESELTINNGQVAVQNSGGTIVAFLDNSSSTTVTWADIDTDSEVVSKTYYIYAYCTTPASDLDFDITISTSSSAPSGITYYRRLGYFYNDASGNITRTGIVNDHITAIDYDTVASAWAYVSTGGTIQDSYNVASVTNNSAGVYTMVFTNAVANANYCVVCSTDVSTDERFCQPTSRTTSGFVIHTEDEAGNHDNEPFNFIVFGD